MEAIVHSRRSVARVAARLVYLQEISRTAFWEFYKVIRGRPEVIGPRSKRCFDRERTFLCRPVGVDRLGKPHDAGAFRRQIRWSDASLTQVAHRRSPVNSPLTNAA